MIPYDHLARAYSKAYWECRRGEEENNNSDQHTDREKELSLAIRQAREDWRQELEGMLTSERRVVEAILLSWEQWAEAGPALLTFRLTQMLTGHGCFGEYLRKIGAEETAACHHCPADTDTAQHTLEVCETFDEMRGNLIAETGTDLTPAALIMALLAG